MKVFKIVLFCHPQLDNLKRTSRICWKQLSIYKKQAEETKTDFYTHKYDLINSPTFNFFFNCRHFGSWHFAVLQLSLKSEMLRERRTSMLRLVKHLILQVFDWNIIKIGQFLMFSQIPFTESTRWCRLRHVLYWDRQPVWLGPAEECAPTVEEVATSSSPFVRRSRLDEKEAAFPSPSPSLGLYSACPAKSKHFHPLTVHYPAN